MTGIIKTWILSTIIFIGFSSNIYASTIQIQTHLTLDKDRKKYKQSIRLVSDRLNAKACLKIHSYTLPPLFTSDSIQIDATSCRKQFSSTLYLLSNSNVSTIFKLLFLSFS